MQLLIYYTRSHLEGRLRNFVLKFAQRNMFRSFTGNSRKARHVNLSGQTSNTRKGLTPNQKPNATTAGGQAAIAQAQAQRLQRGQDRERLNATRLLQRSWRGHTSRQKTRQVWRADWDQHELARTSPQSSDVASLFEVTPKDRNDVLAYDSAAECYSQMRLLLHFLQIKLEMDRARLTYFGKALQKTLEELPSIATGDSWTLQLCHLSRFTIEALDVEARGSQSMSTGQVDLFLSLLLFLSRLIPRYMAGCAKRYYNVLARLLSKSNKLSRRLEDQMGPAVLALLTPITAETMTAYLSFGTELLTAPDALVRISADRLVAPKLNYKMLTAVLNRIIDDDNVTRKRILDHSDHSMWLLANLIYLHRHSLGASESFHIVQETDYIKLLSALLDSQASEITQRIDILDESMADTAKRKGGQLESLSTAPLPSFVREQILTLIHETSIVGMMSQIELLGLSEQKAESESAQTLATYALTLMKVFPGQRADKIRLWLNNGLAILRTSTGVSAILYLWHYSRSTTIFHEVSEDHRKAVPLLRSFLNLENPMSAHNLRSIQQEWRTMLFFLELYSFAIRNMDDEGFLAGGQFGIAGFTQWGAKIRESSLPLEEVQELVVFLKNLAFALYWNSRDLQDGDFSEEPAGLGAYFGTTAPSAAKRVPARFGEASKDNARIQLRDLVTGVLRSIHHRE